MIETNTSPTIETSDNNLYSSIENELNELKDQETWNDKIDLQDMFTENFKDNLLQIGKENASKLIQIIDSINNVTDPVIIDQLNNLKNILLPIAGYSALDSSMLIEDSKDRQDRVWSDVLDEKLVKWVNEWLENLKTRIKKYLSSVKNSNLTGKLNLLFNNIDKIYKVLNSKSRATNKNFESIWNFLKGKGCVQWESFNMGEVIPWITDFLNKTNEYFDAFDAAWDSFNEVNISNAFLTLEKYLDNSESWSNLDVNWCVQFINWAKWKWDQNINDRIFDMYLRMQWLDINWVNHPDFSSIEDAILANYDINEIWTYEVNKYFEGKTLKQLKNIYPEDWDGSELTQISCDSSEFVAATDSQILNKFNEWNTERNNKNIDILKNLDICSLFNPEEMKKFSIGDENLKYDGVILGPNNFLTQLWLADRIKDIPALSSILSWDKELNRIIQLDTSESILATWFWKIKENITSLDDLSETNVKRLWSKLNAADVVQFYTGKKAISSILTNKQREALKLLHTWLTSDWREEEWNPSYDAIKKLQEMVNVIVDWKFWKDTFRALQEKFNDLSDGEENCITLWNRVIFVNNDEQWSYIEDRWKKYRNVADNPNYTWSWYLLENWVLYLWTFDNGQRNWTMRCISETSWYRKLPYENWYLMLSSWKYKWSLDNNFNLTWQWRFEYSNWMIYEWWFKNSAKSWWWLYWDKKKPVYIWEYKNWKYHGLWFQRRWNLARCWRWENWVFMEAVEESRIEQTPTYQKALRMYPNYFYHLNNDINTIRSQQEMLDA